MSDTAQPQQSPPSSSYATTIKALIFDVDDTLYDVGSGFTAHRNGEAAQQFMVDHLGFPDLDSAKAIRDEYFERYHATAKALTVAEQEGRFPNSNSNNNNNNNNPRFQTKDLAEYWATNLKFDMLGGPKTKLAQDLQELRTNNPNIQLIAFSNGPRKYVIRVLQQLGLWQVVFEDDRLFAVDDVLPYCKPEREAFEVIFDRIGVQAADCVLVEDSMKNIRCAKEMGVKTVLISGTRSSTSEAAEATKPGDAPEANDPAVDCSMEVIEEFRTTLPGLWENPAIFDPCSKN